MRSLTNNLDLQLRDEHPWASSALVKGTEAAPEDRSGGREKHGDWPTGNRLSTKIRAWA